MKNAFSISVAAVGLGLLSTVAIASDHAGPDDPNQLGQLARELAHIGELQTEAHEIAKTGPKGVSEFVHAQQSQPTPPGNE